MLKWLWGGMILVGIIVGIATGRTEEINEAILTGVQDSAALAFSLVGVYALWLGILRVAEDAGLIRAFARRVEGAICRLFRGVERGSRAVGLITLNLVANALGMGNAATPFGLEAMTALQERNPHPDTATHDMCLFLIINTASVQLLPLSIIAVRAAAGAQNPAEIVPTAFLATLVTAVFGVIAAKLCALRTRKWNG